MAAQTNGTHANGVNGTNGVNGHGPSAVCDLKTFLDQDYDFVIVGGGTAGLAIASRLTENPDVKVGVLEAGSDRRGDPLIDTPAAFLQMFGNPDYDWNYKTTPQPGNHDVVHHLVRGRALGGSSAINYMMYVRGSEQDYDDWAEIVGDKSWSSKYMKEYMKKHQTLEPVSENVAERTTMPFVGENHGTSGPVKTSFNDSFLPIEDDIIKACDEVTGYSKKPLDPWSGDHIGFYNTLGTVVRSGPDKGKRSYAARGYLGAAQHRPNLKVLCEAMVAHVDLDGNAATGVTFTHGGQRHSVRANREVLVCGGAIQSPAILELSGIGDPEILKAAGVECKVELPSVGTNFQDHSVAGGVYTLTPGNVSGDAIHIPEVMADAAKQMGETGGGPLTAIQSSQGFLPYKLFATPEELEETVQSIQKTIDDPKTTAYQKKQLKTVIAHLKSDKSGNLQMVFVAATLNQYGSAEDQSILFSKPESGKFGVTIAICLEYPAARGTVHISSSDPAAHPIIDPGYNAHPADVAVMGTGLKFVDLVAKSSALKGKFEDRLLPNPKYDLQKVEDQRAAAQDWIMGEYHPCGSCAMGDTVDSRLRVNGVKNLRVADASIFPTHVSGNIVSSVYMVAEKAADIIKADWDHAALKQAA